MIENRPKMTQRRDENIIIIYVLMLTCSFFYLICRVISGRIDSMNSQSPYMLMLLLSTLIFICGCDTNCISERDVLWDAGVSEYRLELTNNTPFMIEIFVEGESTGIFCSDTNKLVIGNFKKNICSKIEARFFDNPSTVYLDDCTVEPYGACEANNLDGQICYDTTIISKVEARLD